VILKETRQMAGDRLSIMRDKNSSGLGGDPQHCRINEANQTTSVGIAEVNRRLPSAKTKDNSVIKICVRLKARRHPRG
jgi:hypothetical protein